MLNLYKVNSVNTGIIFYNILKKNVHNKFYKIKNFIIYSTSCCNTFVSIFEHLTMMLLIEYEQICLLVIINIATFVHKHKFKAFLTM